MSNDTKRAVESALAAHFADEFNGAVVSSYVIQAYGQKIDSESGFYLGAWPDGQAVHVTGGLIDYAAKRHTARMSEDISDPDDL